MENYDPVYGARPLKRAIVKQLESPISRMLVAHELNDGGHITVDHDGTNFVFSSPPRPNY